MGDSKALTAQEKFEQKLYQRIRDDVAELLPDDVLSEMAHRAIEKMFFEPQVTREKKYGTWQQTKLSVSWFEMKVERLLRERLDKMAKDWLAEHADFLSEQFATVMSSKMPELVAKAIFKPVDSAIFDMEAQLKAQINQYMQQQFNAVTVLP